MQVSPQRLLIPLLISFSITGTALMLIYFINKKQRDRRNPNFTEMSIPRQYVPAIIGRNGSVINEIQSITNTKIRFLDEPHVDLIERTCIITGSPENRELAVDKIKCILNNQPIIEIYEMWVPQRTVARITEKNRKLMSQIQNSSNAKIILEDCLPPMLLSKHINAKRRVIIKGTAEQIAEAFTLIEDKVKEDKKVIATMEGHMFNGILGLKYSPPATPENPPKDDRILTKNERFGNEAIEGLIEVFVSSVESPSQFYIHVVGPSNQALFELTKQMSSYYEVEENRKLHALTDISVGQKVAAKFLTDDGKWHRAEVIDDLGENTYNLYFGDYGKQKTMGIQFICELRTDFLSLRLQAIECSLANVKPTGDEWSTEAIDMFAARTVANWDTRIAKIRGYKERAVGRGASRRGGSPIPCVDLYEIFDHTYINLGEEMINRGLAMRDKVPWSTASSTISVNRNSQDSRARSPEVQIIATSSGVGKHNGNAAQPAPEIDLRFSPQSKEQPKKKSVEVVDLEPTPPAPNSHDEGALRSSIKNERNSLSPRNSSTDNGRNMFPNGSTDNDHIKSPNSSTDYGRNKSSNGDTACARNKSPDGSTDNDRNKSPNDSTDNGRNKSSNGSTDYGRNKSPNNKSLPANPFKQSKSPKANIVPAGYEDDEPEDDDDFDYN